MKLAKLIVGRLSALFRGEENRADGEHDKYHRDRNCQSVYSLAV
jgi:hypothetical protein